MITEVEVAAKAKELGLTLNDEQIKQYVKDGKLPEKQLSREERQKELETQYTSTQLAGMVLEARSEAGARRHELRETQTQLEGLTKELEKYKDFSTKYPELEKQYKETSSRLEVVKENEKKRREAAMANLDEKKREAVSYLLDVNVIGADKFDSTLELLVEPKSGGSGAPPPSGSPPKETLETKLLAAQKAGDNISVIALKRQIAEAQNKR